jgi:hypothetical protein
MYIFHTTSDAVLPDNHGLDIKSPGTWTGIYARNNLWLGTDLGLRNYNTTNPIDLDYDNIHTTGSGNLVFWDTTYYATLAAFTSATGQEMNGSNIPPVFEDAPNGDYRLVGTSNLVDAGCYIPGINDDYAGTAPDLGAFEYIQPVPALDDSALIILSACFVFLISFRIRYIQE